MQSTSSPSIPKPPSGFDSWLDYYITLNLGPDDQRRAFAELASLHSRLAETERERDDARMMLRHGLFGCDDDEPWMAHTPDGRCILFVYRTNDSEEPVEIPLDIDADGLPILDNAARAQLEAIK